MGDESDLSTAGADCHRAATAVQVALDQLQAADLSAVDESELRALALTVQRISRRVDAIAVAVAGQVTQILRPGAGADAPSVAASWLRETLTVTGRTARGWITSAAATTTKYAISGAPILAPHPVVGAALTAGDLSADHARVIIATLGRLHPTVDAESRAMCEKVLVEQGLGCDPVELARIGRQIIAMADPDGVLDEYAAHDAMELHLGRRQANGLTRIWGRLDDLTIEALYAAMTPLAAPRHKKRTACRDEEPPDSAGDRAADSALTALADSTAGEPPDSAHDRAADSALTAHADSTDAEPPATEHEAQISTSKTDVDRCRLDIDPAPPAHDWTFDPVTDPGDPDTVDRHGRPAWITPPDTQDDPDPALRDTRTAATRRAHALAEILRHTLNAGWLPAHGGQRPHLTVTIDHQDLLDQLGAARLAHTGSITAAATRRLACDARILPAVLGGDSEILDFGRSRYTCPPHLRAAVALRDQGCAWPGCDRPPGYTDFHHIKWWTKDLGATSLENGCLLCEGHHIEAHRGRWTIHIDADHQPTFTPPVELDPTQTPRRNHRTNVHQLRLHRQS